jgi:uncharacterized protein YaiI (UPF0178 family)
MKIWIDADACPKQIKELLYKVAERQQIPVVLVANRPLAHPKSRWIRSVLVSSGADVADQEIIRTMEEGDLVITADIPLAAETISRGGNALDPRGEFFSEENISERLSVRNFLDDLRNSGVETGGPSSYTAKDKQKFANQLDRFLARCCSEGQGSI